MATKNTTAAKAPKAEKKGKGAKATPAASSNGDAKKLGKPFIKVLETLQRSKKAIDRSAISQLTGINSGFTSLLGHSDPTKWEPQSLQARGYIVASKPDETGPVVYEITAAGKKALQEAKEAAK